MGLVNASLPLFVRRVGRHRSLESKFRWLTFPGLIRGITILHAFMFVLLLLMRESTEIFLFDWEKIQEGEYWRTVSFILLPPLFPDHPINFLFMYFGIMIAFMINDSLEGVWGPFRTTVYCLSLIFCQVAATIVAALFFEPVITSGGFIFYAGIFFAFATIFPRIEFRLFLILPVQVWVFALIAGVVLTLGAVQNVGMAVYTGLCFFPYLAWAIPRFLKWSRHRGRTLERQIEFRSKVRAPETSFHKCENCGATDHSHPDRDFRVTSDDQELCSACLDAEPLESQPAEEPS